MTWAGRRLERGLERRAAQARDLQPSRRQRGAGSRGGSCGCSSSRPPRGPPRSTTGSSFAPRERAGVASPELAALLDADTSFEQALWLASPHQNLGALDERVGDLELYLAELSRLTGIARPRLPGFGPFALPPAREIAVAWNGSGESLLGVARLEPGVGWIARLAGWLAGNPWLAGGRVEASGTDVRGALAGAALDRRERPAGRVDRPARPGPETARSRRRSLRRSPS